MTVSLYNENTQKGQADKAKRAEQNKQVNNNMKNRTDRTDCRFKIFIWNHHDTYLELSIMKLKHDVFHRWSSSKTVFVSRRRRYRCIRPETDLFLTWIHWLSCLINLHVRCFRCCIAELGGVQCICVGPQSPAMWKMMGASRGKIAGYLVQVT